MKSPKNLFIGHCNRCGETYEAQTGLEDLEGLSFQCKKMLCDGKVELHFSGPGESFPLNPDRSPTRFC